MAIDGSRRENFCASDTSLAIAVTVSCENKVDEPFWRFLGELYVVQLALMRQGDYDLGTLSSEAWNQLLRTDYRIGVDDVWWKGVESCEMILAGQSDESNLDSVR